MRKSKKLIAMLTVAVMMIAMSIPVLAATTPVVTDTKKAFVTNVERTATVTAYQIVEAEYNNNGLVGYSRGSSLTAADIADVLAPTSSEVTALAASELSELSTRIVAMTTTDTTDLATFAADLNPGYWIVLVTGEKTEIYNPMLIGVYYSKAGSDNTMTAGIVDANSDWTLETTNAYAKSTEPSIAKSIVNSGSGNANGDDAAIGDIVNFQIQTVVPSYSEQYSSVFFKITDVLSAGLALDTASIEIVAGDTPLASDNYTLTPDATGFGIEFDSDYILDNPGVVIRITYSAKLTEAAGVNFDPNANIATLEYTNNPNDATDTTVTDDRTYHYTFAIGANLYGDATEIWNKITEEMRKTGSVTTIIDGEPVTTQEPLGGAVFELTNNNTGKAYTATSAASGALSFKGLDAGEYTLVEVQAPEGYTLNNTPIPVKIEATYNANGTLASYSITIGGAATSTYTATYEGDTTVITNITTVEEETVIPNTKLNELPSTGGIGTYIFTIVGVAIIGVAAILLFVNNKKKA